jgi:hypothetical protein
MLIRYACPQCHNEAVLRVRAGYEIPELVPYKCGHTLSGTPDEEGKALVFVCPGEELRRVLTPHPLVDLGSFPPEEE